MKIRKRKEKQVRLSMRNQLRRIKNGASQAFLIRHRVFQALIVLLGAITSLGVVVYILFGSHQVPQIAVPQATQLKTDIVDELELFIELRNTAYENPPAVSLQVFGR